MDREEALEYGVGLDGANDEGDEWENMQARLIAENEDDEQVASDDEEEIDSDVRLKRAMRRGLQVFFRTRYTITDNLIALERLM